MASINDWAAKAAEKIDSEIRLPSLGNRKNYKPSRERIAAIIATFAEPLVKLLRESIREHADGEDGRRRCNKVKYEDEDGRATAGAPAHRFTSMPHVSP